MSNQLHSLAVAFYNLYRNVTIYRRRLTEDFTAENGTTRMLDALYTQEQCSLKRLCKILGILTPTGSVMVEKCVAKGLVDRQPSPSDRRKVVLSLTPQGKEYIEQELDQQYKRLEKAFQNLSSSDQRCLMRNIESIETILKKIELTPEE